MQLGTGEKLWKSSLKGSRPHTGTRAQILKRVDSAKYCEGGLRTRTKWRQNITVSSVIVWNDAELCCNTSLMPVEHCNGECAADAKCYRGMFVFLNGESSGSPVPQPHPEQQTRTQRRRQPTMIPRRVRAQHVLHVRGELRARVLRGIMLGRPCYTCYITTRSRYSDTRMKTNPRRQGLIASAFKLCSRKHKNVLDCSAQGCGLDSRPRTYVSEVSVSSRAVFLETR